MDGWSRTDEAPAKVTIVHVINSLNIGGAETMLVRLLRQMDRTRFTPVVIALRDKGRLQQEIESLGIPVWTLGNQSKWSLMWRFIPLLARLRKLSRSACIFQGWLYHGNVAAQWLAGRIHRRYPVVWNIRRSEPVRSLSRTTRAVVRLGARWSERPYAIVCNTSKGISTHREQGYRGNWEWIPNGFDTERFCPQPDARKEWRSEHGLKEDEWLIGMPAREEPAKDHGNFFDAARWMLDNMWDVPEAGRIKFVLCGRGMGAANERIVQMAEQRGLSGRILFQGEQTDMPRWLNAMDTVTLSSWTEGFPNVIGEAMACGTNVVATDVGDTQSLIAENGFVVPPSDCEALGAAWLRMFRMEPALRLSMAISARQRIEREFSIIHVAERYEQLYAQAAAYAFSGGGDIVDASH